MRKLVCFFLGHQELAAPIEVVRETIGLRPITPVFRVHPAIAGITNLRGDVLAVLDAGVLLGLGPSRRDAASRIVIVQPDTRRAGLLVDRLGEIRDVAPDALGPVPPTLDRDIAALFAGSLALPDRPVGVLDVARIFAAPALAPWVKPAPDAATARDDAPAPPH